MYLDQFRKVSEGKKVCESVVLPDKIVEKFLKLRERRDILRIFSALTNHPPRIFRSHCNNFA